MDSMVGGSNIPVAAASVRGVMIWTSGPKVPDIDVRASVLTRSGKVHSIDDFVFYQRPRDRSGLVRHLGKEYAGHSTSTDAIAVDLFALTPDVDRVVFSATADDGVFRRVPNLRFCLYDGPAQLAQFDISVAGEEVALLLGELYRRAGGWKFRALGQGYTNGLRGLAADHGFRADVSRAAALAADANRRRTRIAELETAARIRCAEKLREVPHPQHGRLRPGALRWSAQLSEVCALSTEQLLAEPGLVPVAADFTLVDQIGIAIEGVYAQAQFTGDAGERSRRPEDRINRVIFGTGVPAAPVPGGFDPTRVGGTRPAGAWPATVNGWEDTGLRWRPRWGGPEARTDRAPGSEAAALPDPAHVLDPVRAVLAQVVLPEPARQEVENLCRAVAYNLGMVGRLSMAQKELHTLVRAADTYLPDSITRYADAVRLLPAGQVLGSGRTVDEELLHAVRVLRDLVDSTMEEAEHDAEVSFLAQSDFLEGKRRG